MDRYKCLVVINKEPFIFKRYGKDEEDVKAILTEFVKEAYGVSCDIKSVEKDEEDVKAILTEFVKEAYGVSCDIKSVEKDKTHPVAKTKEVTNA